MVGPGFLMDDVDDVDDDLEDNLNVIFSRSVVERTTNRARSGGRIASTISSPGGSAPSGPSLRRDSHPTSTA